MSDTRLAFVIEDDFDASVIFEKALQVNGYTTETINKGDLALKRLAEAVPEVILLDLHLPNVQGSDILKHIRQDERLSDVKVVLITADSRMAEEIGDSAELVLLKPTTFSQVRDFTARLTHRSKGVH